MLERWRQNPETHVVLQFDDGIHIRYKWAEYDSQGKEGTIYKYFLGKDPLLLTVPTGMEGRLQRVCCPWFIDPLGLVGLEFTMYRCRKDDYQAWPWASTMEAKDRLSLAVMSSLQFDSTVVRLSKAMTSSAFDMKLILVGLALLILIGGGYMLFFKKDAKPHTDNTTPIVQPAPVTPPTNLEILP